MLTFENRFVTELPGDPDETNRPRQVRGAAWSRVRPTPVASPRTLAVSREMADLLGFTPEQTGSQEFADVFAGNRLWPGMEPYSAAYGGHQFGNWAGQLGDGRAITLGEVVATDATRQELQLKGAGPTPYSRHADGRAVLRSSVREFLCSEAMHHLGVPTTRALSLVATGEPVLRDMFYDGHPELEPGAVVCRVAPSFLRFGSYELPASRGDAELLRKLVEHTLTHYYPHLGAFSKEAVVAMFCEVADRTLDLVVDWKRVGFVHGVMNTDNLSILGLTIDYGPYGWLEPYDPEWTPNTTDAGGRRYRFGTQPLVAIWNLARLAEAWIPLVGETTPFEHALQTRFEGLPDRELAMWRRKLGLTGAEEADLQLVKDLEGVLTGAEIDYTLFCRGLADVSSAEDLGPLRSAWYAPPDESHDAKVVSWLRRWLSRQPDRTAMNRVNPKFVLRNWLAQLAIDRAADGDPTGIHELLEVLRRPYDEQPGHERFAERRPEWARVKPGCSMLSCSS
jgi:uncharacterized protein YdiU (UPF0061 family)